MEPFLPASERNEIATYRRIVHKGGGPAAFNLLYLRPHGKEENARMRLHASAIAAPRREESAVVGLLQSWMALAVSHHGATGLSIAESNVLGEIWGRVASALLDLLDDEHALGRLDPSTLETIILETLRSEGMDRAR